MSFEESWGSELYLELGRPFLTEQVGFRVWGLPKSNTNQHAQHETQVRHFGQHSTAKVVSLKLLKTPALLIEPV